MAVLTENQGLTALFTAEYTANVELLLQQTDSKVRGKVREGSHVGKMASPVNQFGSVVMKQPTGRFAPMTHTQPDTLRPWVFPQAGELPMLIDSFDRLETIVDPQGPYVQTGMAAVNRYYDDVVIAAFFATRQLGTDIGSLTPDSFSTTNFQVASTFGASAAAGLTIAKMIEAKRILEHYHNDLEMDRACAIIGSQQHSDLYNQVQVVSSDFQSGLSVQVSGGRVRQILGIDIVVSERLSVTSNVRNVPVFVKSGMYMGIWKDMTTFAEFRPDLSGRPLQLLIQTMVGSVRMQAGKVVSILCSDTSGTDITP
jgi:hypothetical protein